MSDMPVHLEEAATGGSEWPRSIGRRVWGWFGTLATVVVVVVATLAVVVAVASHLSPEGEYTVLGHPVMSMLSGSMSPDIKTGDLVYDKHISLANAEHLHVGQIITFQAAAGRTFTHRIHAVKTADGSVAYQTKGDANDAPDQSLVTPSRIIGLYEGKVPFGGYVLNALHKPVSLFLLLASPLLWLLSGWLFSLAKEDEQKATAVPKTEEAPVV